MVVFPGARWWVDSRGSSSSRKGILLPYIRTPIAVRSFPLGPDDIGDVCHQCDSHQACHSHRLLDVKADGPLCEVVLRARASNKSDQSNHAVLAWRVESISPDTISHRSATTPIDFNPDRGNSHLPLADCQQTRPGASEYASAGTSYCCSPEAVTTNGKTSACYLSNNNTDPAGALIGSNLWSSHSW